MAGDAVSVAPNLYKVLFENDRMRILDTRYGPGVKSEMHSHPTTPFCPRRNSIVVPGLIWRLLP